MKIPHGVETRSMTSSSRTLRSSGIKKEEEDFKVTTLTLHQTTTTKSNADIKDEPVEQDSKQLLSIQVKVRVYD